MRYAETDLPLEDNDAETLAESLDRLTLAKAEIAAERLRLIADYDDRGLWKHDGAASMAGWLAARYGTAGSSASEEVRVAHALQGLPRIAEAHRSARLSWDQLKPLTRFVRPDEDQEWAERAPRWRPSSLWREERRRRRVEERIVAEARRIRSLSLWRDPEGTLMFLEGTLPAEDGAALEAALHRAAKEIPRDEDARDPEGARVADALVALCTRWGPETARRETTLMVHADAEVLAGATSGAALAETEAGDRFTADAVRRLACDARIDWVLEHDGSPVRIGTGGRSVPERLRRTLLFRDEGCRFPGCAARRFVDAHHIVHWGDGGPTALDNLVMLCGAHHRLIHEGGWRISGHPGRDLRFHDPTGRRLRTHPEPLARARAPAPVGG